MALSTGLRHFLEPILFLFRHRPCRLAHALPASVRLFGALHQRLVPHCDTILTLVRSLQQQQGVLDLILNRPQAGIEIEIFDRLIGDCLKVAFGNLDLSKPRRRPDT